MKIFLAIRCSGKECSKAIGIPTPIDAKDLMLSMAVQDWIVWSSDDGDGDHVARCLCMDCAKIVVPQSALSIAIKMNKQTQEAIERLIEDKGDSNLN